MKTITHTLIFLLIISLFSLAACKKDKENNAASVVTASPPSVNEDKLDENQIIEIPESQRVSLTIPLYSIKTHQKSISIIAPGEVHPAPNYIAIISAPVEGRVINMQKNEGDPINKGQVLLELESLDFGSLVADYLQADAEEKYQTDQLTRITQLVEKGISPESQLEKVKANYARAQASIRAAYARLKTVGATNHDIEKMASEDKITPHLKVLSPITGAIDTHSVELGQAVSVNEQLATVMNLDKVLVKSYVSPEDARLVAIGDSVEITHRLMETSPIWGLVTSLNPGLDALNKSMVVNVLLDNPAGWLKPGNILRTKILSQAKKELISIPLEAITYNNNDPVVFVRVADYQYEMRTVLIEEFRGEVALLSSGLKMNEEIAIGQTFSLKALARYELIAED